MNPRYQRRQRRRKGFWENDGGCGVAVMGLRNWRQRRRRCQRKMRPRTRRWRRGCQQRKQKRRHATVNVSNGGGGGVITVQGNWRWQWWSWRSKTGPRTQWRQLRRRRRTRNRRRVKGIREINRGSGGLTMVPRHTRRWQRCRRRNISTKTSTTTMESLEEDRRRVQWIGDNDGGGSCSTTVPMDWQWQWSVNFPCYHVDTSNPVSSLSRRCPVLILFSSYYFLTVHCKKDYQ